MAIPLRSKLFGGDTRLAACLVEDAKHVAPGDRGPHVSKIQCAVLMLEGGTIAGAELTGTFYGPMTAKAVLAYKRRRRIINTSYQSQPDNIVGKMTMRALDDEMSVVEAQELHGALRQ